MKLFRPLLAAMAVAAVFTMVVADADARPRVSAGSRGSKTFSAPPPTATAPNAAAPINRTMTQPGTPGVTQTAARPPVSQPGGMFGGGRGLLGGLAAGLLGAGLIGMLMGNGFLGGLAGLRVDLRPAAAGRADRAASASCCSAGGSAVRSRSRLSPACRARWRTSRSSVPRSAASVVSAAAPPRRPSSRSRSSARTSTRSSACSARSRPPMAARTSPRCAAPHAGDAVLLRRGTVREREPRRRQPDQRREAAAGRSRRSLARRRQGVCQRRDALLAGRPLCRSRDRPASPKATTRRRRRPKCGPSRARAAATGCSRRSSRPKPRDTETSRSPAAMPGFVLVMPGLVPSCGR